MQFHVYIVLQIVKYLLVHLILSIFLLNNYLMPATILDPWDTSVNKMGKSPCPYGSHIINIFDGGWLQLHHPQITGHPVIWWPKLQTGHLRTPWPMAETLRAMGQGDCSRTIHGNWVAEAESWAAVSPSHLCSCLSFQWLYTWCRWKGGPLWCQIRFCGFSPG